MHEVSIALAVLEQIAERTSDEPIERVSVVRLRIGAMTGIVPQALEFAWELCADGTVAQGSVLEIERVPLAIFCTRCQARREPPSDYVPLPVCLACGESSTQILAGRDCSLPAWR